MRTTTRRHLRRTGAVAALTALGAATGLGALILGAAPAGADTTTPQTVVVDLGDLDEVGSGAFDQFDPDLGTLTAVSISAEVSMSFDVCVTNLSETATSVPSGEVSGEAALAFAGGVIATADDAMTVPPLELAASDGGDDCRAFADSGTPPASADSELTSQSGAVESFATTLTDAADLAPYIGTGTVSFDWTASSNSDINQPSEWTIVFLAGGEGEATISYEYTPEEPEPSQGISDDGATDKGVDAVSVVAPGADSVAVAAEPPSEVPSRALPDTGGPYDWLVALAGLLLMTGGGLIALRRAGSDAS